MAWTIYRSTDASAPVLTGEAGKLVAVLDACLVDGYGAKAAAGWSTAYTAANKRVYRQASTTDSAIQAYLRVLDDASTTGVGRVSQVNAYETMSDIDTGTNQFSGVANAAAAGFIRKSSSADATARAWILAADDRTFYFFAYTEDTAGYAYPFQFGDIYSFVTSDLYRVMYNNGANDVTTAGTTGVGNLGTSSQLALSTTAAILSGQFIMRSYLGTGTAVNVNKTSGTEHRAAVGTASLYLTGNMPFPNPSDGSFILTPIYVNDPATAPAPSVRGQMRGVYQGAHLIASLGNGDTFGGTGDFAGKTFEIVFMRCYSGTSTTLASTYIVLETSDTVATN